MERNPIPQGRYVPAVRYGNLVYTAGMTPRKDGVLMMTGPVVAGEPLETYQAAVEQAARNALTAARNCLAEGEKIAQVLSLTVFVNAAPGFTTHARVGDLASNYLYDQLGDAGIGPRAAVGMSSLPGDAPVEIQLIVAVE